jgi:hypothetical protein
VRIGVHTTPDAVAPELGDDRDAFRARDLLDRGPDIAEAGALADDRDAGVPAAPRDLDEAQLALEAYGAIARDLALARRLAPRSRARDYLEDTYARLHAEIHRPPLAPAAVLRRWIVDELPATVRWLRPYLAAVTLLFVVAALTGAWLVTRHPGLVSLFASEEMIATVERGELWTDGMLNVLPSSVLSAQILTNNIIATLVVSLLRPGGALSDIGIDNVLYSASGALTLAY